MSEQRDSPPKTHLKKKSIQGVPARKLALEVLLKIQQDAAYANLALNAALNKSELSLRDKAFVTALVQGVTRNRLRIDATIEKSSAQPLSKLAPSLLNILRLAVFQFEDMSDIPKSAVVNTSNELARMTGHKGHAKFANGVLRAIGRKMEAADARSEQRGLSSDKFDELHHVADGTVSTSDNADTPSETLTESELALKYSMPQWLVKRWLQNFGAQETVQLLEFALSEPPMTMRTCELSITPEGLQDLLKGKKIVTRRSELVPSCLIVEKKVKGKAEDLFGYSEGLFSIQDEAAAFASVVVAPEQTDLVIDLCAAPGGKSLHLAEMMENKGRVIAVDKSERRLELMKASRVRLELNNIEIVAADGREFKLERLADKVLLDAPCTGTGVMNRRTDLRYQRNEGDIAVLAELQRELLANAASLLKPGGVLVYSTCSIEPEENFDNVRWFLAEFPEFEGDDITRFLPPRIKAEVNSSLASSWQGLACKNEQEITHMIQLLPSRHQVSGFFVARLKKRSS